MEGFDIEKGILKKYSGKKTHVEIPDGVEVIGNSAFSYNEDLISVTIPDSVTEIQDMAFAYCSNLTSINIPDSVTEIGYRAFYGCLGLGLFIIGDEFYSYAGEDVDFSVPEGVRVIKENAFEGCYILNSITLSDTVTEIEDNAFEDCESLTSIIIPDSVKKIGMDIFNNTPDVTVVCSEGSEAHQYCLENDLTYVIDYQYESFQGLLPPGYEELASPFLADEEKPYIFISYSHKDRDTVLPIIKTLYESGWKVWYDEGLTIGDSYDETLESHVRNCAAFLLFVSDNSLKSMYCRDNEIPWAVDSDKPIIKCILDEEKDYLIAGGSVIATVSPEEIEPALEKVSGLCKGKRRVAKGISVVVNPNNRGETNEGGFAYCLYTDGNAASAKAIMLDAKNNGCLLYDGMADGVDEEKLQSCACLIVFLDKAFLSDEHLTEILIEAFQEGRDIAVCQLEDIEEDDLPEDLIKLHLMQWLNYTHGINADMNTKLARHLQKRGCRDSSALPGFEYEKTDKGIVITKYTGLDPNPRVEREYGGVPVVEIAEEAFKNCVRLKTIVIDGVPKIGDNAFTACTSLSAVSIGKGTMVIGNQVFWDCTSLSSVDIPESVTEIGKNAFWNCKSLTSIAIPEAVTVNAKTFGECEGLTDSNGFLIINGDLLWYKGNNAEVIVPDSVASIGGGAFADCVNMTAIHIPDSVIIIGASAFCDCSGLTSITIPENVSTVDSWTFKNCVNLASVIIANGVREIGMEAFKGCVNLTEVDIPKSVKKIEYDAFEGCENLTVICPQGSYTWKYCNENDIPVKAAAGSSGTGLFGKLFGQK